MATGLRYRGNYPYFSYTDSGGCWDQVVSSYGSFAELRGNRQLDSYVKWAALGAAPSVVCLKIYSDEKEKRCGSGFIISCDNVADGLFEGIIISSTSLLRVDDTIDALLDDLKVVVVLADGEQMEGVLEAFDYHFNIAAIKVQSVHPLETSRLKNVDDCILLDRSQTFTLRPHGDLYQLSPGSAILSLGRYHDRESKIMVAPGVYSIEQCRFTCKELMRSTCRITKCGIGGPVINENGEVIGMNFFALGFTPFMPINMVVKWWKLSKRSYRRPYLGIESSNLFTVGVDVLEKIRQKFPDLKFFDMGIIVDEVAPSSPADSVVIQPGDIIIRCDGADVRSSLQFFDQIWDKVGKSVELVAIRTTGDQRTVTVVVADTNQLNSWPIPDYGRVGRLSS